MTVQRLVAIFIIFSVAAVGWMALGGSIELRTADAGGTGWESVGSLWGEPQFQQAPRFRSGTTAVPIAGSDITADISLDQRRKGLLWYATYTLDFDATYTVRNDSVDAQRITMELPFPTPMGVYDGFSVVVDGETIPVTYREGSAFADFPVAAGHSAVIETGYRTQGLDEWRYQPTEGVGVVDEFSLVVRTDFDGYDFPGDGTSPTSKTSAEGGDELRWTYDSLVSGRAIAVRMPTPINPGPVASRISFFAPVSLLFYFAALVLVTATRRVSIHPMNFAFLAAGFFAFHLLFAYLVDRVDIGAAFAIASTVSVGMCVSYLRLAISDRSALVEAAIGQLVFLVLFSFSFFFEGYTGLAVTIGAVLTLGYFMFKTGGINWSDVFARSAADARAAKENPTLSSDPS